MGANTVVGQYVLERPLGEGGMAEVWLAWHLHLGTPAAIKFLNRSYAGHAEIEQRFLNEGRRQGALNHPNIVKVYGFEYVAGRSFLILQYIDGEPLDRRLERMGRLDPFETVRIATGALNALECAHHNNIVHRDIKPSNILLDANGFPYLGDFGIVLAMNEQRITRAGTVMGTSYYMSPEQITTPNRVDNRADIYSFGCVLFEVLTGRPPFEATGVGDGDADFAIKTAHVQQMPPPLRQFNPYLTPELEAVVMRCLAKNPDYRYRTCGELRDALAMAAAGPQAQNMAQIMPPPKRNWLAVVIPLLLVLAGVGGWLWYRFMKPSVAVETVAICQGAFDAAQGSCNSDPASKVLTVFARFHDAKPGQSTMRDEWTLDGKPIQKPDPHILRNTSGVFYQQLGTADTPGDYKVTVFADGMAIGSSTLHVTPPVFGIDKVSICQGAFESGAGTCSSNLSSRVLTVYTHFHDAKAGQTTLRNEWELDGRVIQRPAPHTLQNESAVYYQQYGTADAPGDYKVTVFADGTPLGTATIHVALPSFAVDNVTMCQGAFNSTDGSCRADLSSRQLTVVAHFHGATPHETTVSCVWELNGRAVQRVAPFALRYEHGFYYDTFTVSSTGVFTAPVCVGGAAAGNATARMAPQSTFRADSIAICRGTFNSGTGVCLGDASSKVLNVVCRFRGATPGRTTVRIEWSFLGAVIQKSDPYALRFEHGWYYQTFGTARFAGDYTATVFVDGVPVGNAVARVAR
jgi:hypothetical protein